MRRKIIRVGLESFAAGVAGLRYRQRRPCTAACLLLESDHENHVQQVAAENSHVSLEELENGSVVEWTEQ